MKLLILVVVFLAPSLVTAQQFDTVRFCTYNLTQFGIADTSRIDELKTVLNEIQPDVLCVQNLYGENAVNLFRDSVSAKLDRPLIPITNIPSINRKSYHTWIFYDSSKIQRGTTVTLNTPYAYVVFRNRANMESFIIWSADFTQGNDISDQDQRVSDVQALYFGIKAFRSVLVFKDPQIVAGSLGMTSSNEVAYQSLVADTANVRFWDPLGRDGDWHNNSQFSDIHTWNTKGDIRRDSSQFGIKGRLDHILTESVLLDRIVPGSYTTFGNDGQHFRDSINAAPNSAVSPKVAQALHDASDHLPVYLDLLFEIDTSGIEEESTSQKSLEIDLTQQIIED